MKQIGKHLMNSLLVVQKKSNLKLIKKNQGKNINYICFAFISHVDIAYNIYIRILGFLFIIVLFFSCLRSDIFSQDLPKKPHSFFPSSLDFGRVGEKEKNVVFSWWAVCEFKECENFKGWDTCSTKLYYFFIGQKNKHFSELIYLFSLCN